MRSFTTPPKLIQDRSPSHSSLREGDWICFNCRNLNFSFRKKCNRCKIQTKEQNDQLISYYYSMDQNLYSGQFQVISNFSSNSIFSTEPEII
jgi:hypothetical protein